MGCTSHGSPAWCSPGVGLSSSVGATLWPRRPPPPVVTAPTVSGNASPPSARPTPRPPREPRCTTPPAPPESHLAALSVADHLSAAVASQEVDQQLLVAVEDLLTHVGHELERYGGLSVRQSDAQAGLVSNPVARAGCGRHTRLLPPECRWSLDGAFVRARSPAGRDTEIAAVLSWLVGARRRAPDRGDWTVRPRRVGLDNPDRRGVAGG